LVEYRNLKQDKTVSFLTLRIKNKSKERSISKEPALPNVRSGSDLRESLERDRINFERSFNTQETKQSPITKGRFKVDLKSNRELAMAERK